MNTGQICTFAYIKMKNDAFYSHVGHIRKSLANRNVYRVFLQLSNVKNAHI